jgi:hypothetical protein
MDTRKTFEQYVHSRFADAAPRRLSDGTWLTYSKEFKNEESHNAVVHKWNCLVGSGREVRLFGWPLRALADRRRHVSADSGEGNRPGRPPWLR